MSANLSALFYLASGVLFILALRGLSSPETSRQGNVFGITGMIIAIIVTFLSVENFSLGFVYVIVFLLAGGAKGKRSALPNSRIMIHQPLGGAEGQASDIKILSDEILRLREKLNFILSKNTKQSLKKIEKDTDRNFFMSSDEAKKYGLIDTILDKRK